VAQTIQAQRVTLPNRVLELNGKGSYMELPGGIFADLTNTRPSSAGSISPNCTMERIGRFQVFFLWRINLDFGMGNHFWKGYFNLQ